MNIHLLPSDSPRGVIILFLGWGTGLSPFLGLRKPGYDIILVNGYEGFNPEELGRRLSELRAGRSQTGDWQETVVVGWSFGVRAASEFLRNTSMNVTLRLAVNGTVCHIDDNLGIPRQVFDGTLRGLSAATLRKFRLRTAGSGELFNRAFGEEGLADEEALASLRSELEWFGNLEPDPEAAALWDKAIVGSDDRIFPPQNQLRAWENTDVFRVDGMPHMPDFNGIIAEFVTDKMRVADKFGSTRREYSRNADAQKHTASRLYSLFLDRFRDSALEKSDRLSVFEAGHGDGTFTRLYFFGLADRIERILLADISRDAWLPWNGAAPARKEDMICGSVVADVESEEFAADYLSPESFDVILSASMLQWLNSPSAFIGKCARALRPGGVAAIAYYGEGTLPELGAAGMAGLKYPSSGRMVSAAETAGLTVDLALSEEISLEFDSPAEALRHLKLTGVNALPVEAGPAATRRLLRDWPLTSGGMATVTFAPVYLILSKPSR